MRVGGIVSGQEFQIGLTMAGAISAGAYSAGVFDFLIQALEAWERARLDPTLADQIPNHRVGIKVITGASAGAITGALGAAGLAQKITPQQFGTALKQQVTCVLPCLYDAWVVRPALVSATGGTISCKRMTSTRARSSLCWIAVCLIKSAPTHSNSAPGDRHCRMFPIRCTST